MFKSAATKLAHNTMVPGLGGNKDLKPLQDLITAEKSVLTSLQKLSQDYAKAAEALKIWGAGEGEDLGDVLGASTTLLTIYSNAIAHYASLGHAMRDQLKSIRTREENLDELKRRRKALGTKADSAEKKLAKMGSEHKNMQTQTDLLNALRAEMRNMDSDIMSEEAYLGDFKRSTTKTWMTLKFGGMLECSEKGTIAGEFGKLVVAEIPEDQTQPGMARSLYYGRPKVETLLGEAHRCISEVKIATGPSDGSSDTASSRFQRPPNHHMGQSSTGATEWAQPPPDGFIPPTWTGNSQFIDQHPQGSGPGSPTHHQFSQHHQQQSSISGTGGAPPPFLTGNPDTPRQTVDDFGVIPNSATSGISSPFDSHTPGNSARFATFPVKNRPQGIVAPPPDGAANALRSPAQLNNQGPQQPEDSFSSSVMEALRSSQSPPGTQPGFGDQQPGGFSSLTSAGGQMQSFAPPEGPPPGWAGTSAGLPPGAAAPQPGYDSHQDAWKRESVEENVTLAYMNHPTEEMQQWREHTPGGSGDGHQQQQQGPGHVRFSAEPGQVLAHGHGYGHGGQWQGQEDASSRSPPHQAGQGLELHDTGASQHSSHPPSSFQPPHSPVARETSPLSQPSQEQQRRQSLALSENEQGANLSRYPSGPPEYSMLPRANETPHDPEHSVPPSPPPNHPGYSHEGESSTFEPPYMNQKRVPPPTFDLEDSEPSYNKPGMSLQHDQAPDRSESPYERGRSPPQQGQGGGYSEAAPLAPPSAPFARGPSPQLDSLYGSPQQSPVSRLAALQSDDTKGGGGAGRFSPISITTNSAYQTLNEFPNRQLGGSSVPGTPTGTTAARSQTSLAGGGVSPQVPSGARTISAAAFRRPAARMASGNEVPGVADTTPLALKKRLPSSSYPAQQPPVPSQQQPYRARSISRTRDGSPRPSRSREGSPRPSLSERERSGSIPPQPPLPSQMNQALPPLPSKAGEEEYDYLSAYVHTGGTPGGGQQQQQQPYHQAHQQWQQGQQQQGGGYSGGRYATNLDDSLT